MEISKRDWKLFREKLTSWQAAYMEGLIQEYKNLLNDSSPASSKFWALEKRIKLDKKKPGVLVRLDKQEMVFNIVGLINDGVINMDDLEEFSDGLKETVKHMLRW